MRIVAGMSGSDMVTRTTHGIVPLRHPRRGETAPEQGDVISRKANGDRSRRLLAPVAVQPRRRRARPSPSKASPARARLPGSGTALGGATTSLQLAARIRLSISRASPVSRLAVRKPTLVTAEIPALPAKLASGELLTRQSNS